MSEVIETDYLVVGAGAAGMAFTDSLLTHSDAAVTIIDRRYACGGHWLDAYPFVRLHQPTTFYGVASVPMEHDGVERSGLNAGFHELAGADELRAYFARVMQEHFIPSGRVRYFPGSDYLPDPAGRHRFVSHLTGVSHEVSVRRKLVDTSYLEGNIPAVGLPPFEVAEGVRCVPVGELTRLRSKAERFVVIGAGKTALDACVWLQSRGVRPSAIRWVKPREGWWLNRRFHQPHAFLPEFYASQGMQLRAIAQATSVADVFGQLESDGVFLRVDTAIAPTMCHGAIVSEAELGLLRQIEDVVRLGRVRRIERDCIVLDEGTVPTDTNAVHVHCAARGLAKPPLRPIFETGRVTIQPCFWGFASYQFAMLGVVEATIESDHDKNQLCPPIAYWDKNVDYLSAYRAAMAFEQARAEHPALAAWAKGTRLNPLGAIGHYRDHPGVAETHKRIREFGLAAARNIGKLILASD